MKKTLLFLFAVFTVQIIYSQSDYRKAYVIKLNRDTIHGFASFSEGVKNNHYCQFKDSQDGKKITYNPSEIFGYGFTDDKYFESKEIESSASTSDTVLLEVLVKGLVSLYKYENVFYIDKADTGLVKISNETLESTENGTMMSRKSTKYIGLLGLYLSDSDQIKSKLATISYGERDFTSLIEKYNGYMNASAKTFKEKRPWIHLKAGVLGGTTISSIEFSSIEDFYKHLVAPFENSITPLMGISLNISSPRITENFSIQTDVIYFKSNYYSYNKWSNNTDYVSIWLTQLKVPFGLRYTFPSGKFKPFLTIGLSTTFILSSESDWIRETETKSIEPFAQVPRHTIVLSNDEALDIRTNQPGVWGGAGIEKSLGKKLTGYLEFRYEKAQGLSTEELRSVLSSGSQSIQFTIGIKTK